MWCYTSHLWENAQVHNGWKFHRLLINWLMEWASGSCFPCFQCTAFFIIICKNLWKEGLFFDTYTGTKLFVSKINQQGGSKIRKLSSFHSLIYHQIAFFVHEKNFITSIIYRLVGVEQKKEWEVVMKKCKSGVEAIFIFVR